jgi:hypothetical protein
MQSNVLMKFVSGISNLVAAGLEIPKIIAKHWKPFSDGDYIKESWLECVPFLFDGFPEKGNKIFNALRICQWVETQ